MRYNLAAQDAKWAELQAEEKGIERGMTKGMDQAMLAMIETLAEQGMPKEQIITTIAKARKLSLLAARQYYNQLMLSKWSFNMSPPSRVFPHGGGLFF